VPHPLSVLELVLMHDPAGVAGALGAAIAHRLAKDGFRIVGLARNVQVNRSFYDLLSQLDVWEQAGVAAMAALTQNVEDSIKILRCDEVIICIFMYIYIYIYIYSIMIYL
jgi:hypothetical protein